MTAATYDSSITMIGVSEQHQNITMSELGDLHMRTLKQMAEKAVSLLLCIPLPVGEWLL